MDIDLFYVDDCARFKDAVARRLGRTFGLDVRDAGILPIWRQAWNDRRHQYDAYLLLDDLVRQMRSKTTLWVVDEDIFCENVNFVFGLAMFHVAAVVSTFRLGTQAMVVKEAVHEVGHVMGLQHCRNRCVMRFSNTYEDALQKPDTLCEACQKSIERRLIKPDMHL
jgi:Predicted Zn-dependent proteases